MIFANMEFAQSLLMQAQKHAVQKITESQVTISILYCYCYVQAPGFFNLWEIQGFERGKKERSSTFSLSRSHLLGRVPQVERTSRVV